MNQNAGLTSPERITAASLPRRTVWEAWLSPWYSSRPFAFTLLAIAVIVGAYYRFHQLDRWDMNGDEAVAWAAATKPSLHKAAETFWKVEYGGKLPVYDIVLHIWVRLFGDSLFAMRAMSAALGTLAVVLLFAAVREVGRSLGGPEGAEAGEVGGGFAALICALNLKIVLSDRTAREFPLLIVAELLQIIFFVRAHRRTAFLELAGIAVCTAIMLADNYCSTFLLFGEALWLGGLLLARWAGSPQALALSVFRPGLGVAAGVVLLVPFVPLAVESSRRAVQAGAVDWIRLRPISWPYDVFRHAAGEHLLLELLEFSILFGLFRQWRSAGRLVWAFLAAWMLGPVLAAFLATYLIHPMELPRYVLIAFLGMFALAGFGAGSVRSTAVRILLAALIIFVSQRAVGRGLEIFEGTSWREATELAVERTAARDPIAVFLPYNVEVVRFYLPPARRMAVVGMDTACGAAPVLLLSDRKIARPEQIAAAEACYPRVVAKLREVEVRAR